MRQFSFALQQSLDAGLPFIVATLIDRQGHVPQDAGAKAIISLEGLVAGTVGGGKLEAKAIAISLDMLRDGMRSIRMEKIDLQRDLGMTCGGSSVILLEPVFPINWTVAVFGAGHIAQALIPLLSTLECMVHVIDDRQ